jgi:YrbI family 3-deoxy-D-manno-octulosonate 8-phosphate phosphatase
MKNRIKLVVMDVDGVLTDGGMYYSENGEVMKKFNTRDGTGISLLRENDIITAIITGEDSEIVLKRAEKLKVDQVYIGIRDKGRVMHNLVRKYNINYDEVAYIGDDLIDLDVMKKVGLSFAPNDAMPGVKQVANHVLSRKGGEGAVREAIDFLLGNHQ